jgi:hypothetical protein
MYFLLRSEKMKLRALICVLMLTFMANSAFAIYYWDLDQTRAPLIGLWANPNNWKATNSTDPATGNDPQATAANGDQEIQAYGMGAVITVDRNITFSVHYSNRARVFGGASLNIIPGGTLQALGWIRVGEKSQPGASSVIQTGGAMIFENGIRPDYADPGRLTLGDGGGGGVECTVMYHISAGTLTYLQPEAASGGQITVGDRVGVGIFRVTGTAPVIQMSALEMGGRAGSTNLTARASDATLIYDIVAGGVSAIGCSTNVYAKSYDASVTHLVLNLTETLDDPDAEIILVDNQGSNPVVGLFSDLNGRNWGGVAPEGAYVKLGDDYRILTYVGGDGNDIALLVPEPATLALLSLGMFVIRRKK